MVFKSRVDTWIIPLLLLVPLTSIGLMIAAALFGGAGLWFSALFVSAMTAASYIGLVWPVLYLLSEEALVIRSGLLKTRIVYADLKGVAPKRSLVGSPALSLDRLHLDHGEGMGTYISPLDKEAFLTTLLTKCPHLGREGARLVPLKQPPPLR